MQVKSAKQIESVAVGFSLSSAQVAITFSRGIFKIEETATQCSTYVIGITQSPGSPRKDSHIALLLQVKLRLVQASMCQCG